MEQKNSQELDTKLFSDLIYDPSAITASDAKVLAGLVDRYPYAQLLSAFYARSLVDSPTTSFQNALTKAALLSPDASVLRTIIEDPESIRSMMRPSDFEIQNDPAVVRPVSGSEETIEAEKSVYEPEVIPEEEPLIFEEFEEVAPDPAYSILEEMEEDNVEKKGNEDGAEDEVGIILATEPDSPEKDLAIVKETQIRNEDDLEKEDNKTGNETHNPIIEHDTPVVNLSNEDDDLDLLIRQNVSSADFLKHEEAINPESDITEDVFTPEADIAEKITHNAVIQDQQKISRYDDDKMPYSFLWWLSKTRKEHAHSYQPYVSFRLDTSQNIRRNTVDQLSTQIIENIFHLQSPVDELENAPKTVPFQVKRKEDFIVEKFIREEPQIKPPNSEKLDNENKARKSAEDPNDLVSETLAHIYTDQMLFHKAIETYKKLSLKFPEKSTYFADQIRELEKKIN